MSDSLLSFDLSFTQTGYCLLSESKILEIGSFPLLGKCRGEKLNCLYKKASDLIVRHEPSVICIEDVFFSRFTATSFKPLLLLQSVMKLLAFRLNRSEPQRFLASEVRASFDLGPSKMKKDFLAFSKKMGYAKKDSKAQSKRRYETFKKDQMVAKVNSIFKKDYPYGLLT